MDRRRETPTVEIHKFVPMPYGNHVGHYLCRRSVREEDLATFHDERVNCPRCLGIMAMNAAQAA